MKFFSRSILPVVLIIFSIQFLNASSPDWVDDPGGYEFTATISGGIILNEGQQMGDDGDLFAAFDEDGNVRGLGLMLFPPFGPYQGTPVFEVQLRSNAAGDLLSFKYYDASEDAILDVVETYEFVINDILGDVINPISFNIQQDDNNAPDWVDCPGCYEFTATISGGIVLNTNGDQMGDDGDMFAAFDADGNVRGIGLMLFPPFGPYQDTPVFEVQLRSNAEGDLLHFRYYDASEDVVLDIIETYEFVINDILGDVINPVFYNIGSGEEECVDDDVATAPVGGCAAAVATFGCDFLWGGVSLSELCPVSCGTCSVGTSTIDILYNTTTDIGGFQFNVEGVTLINASGGAAAEAGFLLSINASNGMVLGFSMSGATIPAGSGTLVVLEIDGSADDACLTNIIFSDVSANPLENEVVDCLSINELAPIPGCMNEIACNYNSDATVDDGSCEYILDCLSVCGGSAELDDCGVCGGDDSSCTDCNDVPNGDSVVDNCGTCDNDPSNDCDMDCSGDWGGSLENDECGVCDGDGSTCEDFECDSAVCMNITNVNIDAGTLDVYMINDEPVGGFQFELTNIDITGASGGTASDADFTVQTIGINGPWDSQVLAFSFTGATIPPGSGILTQVSFSNFDGEICFGDDTGSAGNNVISDASGGYIGTTWGSCYDPNCPSGIYDCLGDCEGEAVEDECGVCDGSGLNVDGCCGEATTDCAGVCDGSSVEDECGVCNGDGSSCGSSTVDYCLDLHSGANLISFYGLPDDISITHVMSSIEGNATGVIGEGVAANYNGTDWEGSLNTISSLSGYWVIVSEAGSLCIEDGIPTDPAIQYSLHSGANLISFPIEGSVEISSSLPDDIEGFVSGIIGEGVAANNQPPWQGSLSALSGGNGYWMITTESISFSFDVSTMSRIKFDGKVRLTAPDNKEIHQSTQQAFYFIENIILDDGMQILEGDWILTYNGKTLVGARQWNGAFTDVPAMGYDGAFETDRYSKNGSMLTFKVQQNTTGKIYQIMDAFPAWKSNKIFNLAQLTAREMPDELLLVSAYPNPFNPVTNITFGIETDAVVIAKIFDVTGREVAELANGIYSAGYHVVNWNADSHSSGLYFLTITVEGFSSGNGQHSVHTQKLMLLK